MEESIWKPIPDYEGIYEYDQFGRIKNFKKQTISIGSVCGRYRSFVFCKINTKQKRMYIHRLVWEYHNGSIPKGYEVHHEDENKLNNNILNLKLKYYREHKGEHKTSPLRSKFIGVCFDKKTSKWSAQIVFKKRKISLGYFVLEIQASDAYQKALKEINSGLDINIIYPIKIGNKFPGVYYNKTHDTWAAKHKGKHIGTYNTEKEAKFALDNYKANISKQ